MSDYGGSDCLELPVPVPGNEQVAAAADDKETAPTRVVNSAVESVSDASGIISASTDSAATERIDQAFDRSSEFTVAP